MIVRVCLACLLGLLLAPAPCRAEDRPTTMSIVMRLTGMR
jgi:hypothetical protein